MPIMASERNEGKRSGKGMKAKPKVVKRQSQGWKRRTEAPAQDQSVDDLFNWRRSWQ